MLASLEDLRCLNVRQPWAFLLVEGIKTIENRPPGANRPYFSKRMNLGDDYTGEWVLIVASALQPGQRVMTQALSDFRSCYGTEGQRQFDLFERRHAPRWSLGCIVGVVRFNLLVTSRSLPSSQEDSSFLLNPCALRWYRGPPHVGWHVRDAIAFNTPIPNIPGCQSISRIVCKGREIERRIRHALRYL